MYKLLHGDCLELMKKISDKSIDMILCDLPYGTTACKWDNVIPFDLLWGGYNRIIKDNGAIILFGSEPFSSKLRLSNLGMYKYDWIWDKISGVGFFDCKFRPLKTHEIISVFSKGGCSNGSKLAVKYNPQGVIRIEKLIKNKKVTSEIFHSKTSKDYISKGYNYPKSIIQFSKDKKTAHPTQKPVALLEYLIKTYTNEGELVLDNCMGSGSTGVACINTNRNFIGMELDDKYFDIAKERIEKANSEV